MAVEQVPVQTGPEPVADPVGAVIGRGVEAGIITADQARRLREIAPPAPPASGGPRAGFRQPVLVEALGYVGGAVVVAGSLLIASQVWHDLPTVGRLAVLGPAACALVVGGVLSPRTAPGDRLRAVLFLAATGVFAGFLGVLADEAIDLPSTDAALLTSAGTAGLAATLWWFHRRPLSQVAMMVTAAILAGVVVDRTPAPTDAIGLGVLGVGLVWALLGWGALLRPERLALVLGSALALLGAMITAGSTAGEWLTLLVVVLVLVGAVVLGDLLLLAVGAVGALVNLPRAIGRWFPDSATAGVVVLALGAALLVLAVAISRRGRSGGGHARAVPAWAVGTPNRSLLAIAVVVASVVLAVVVLSLV